MPLLFGPNVAKRKGPVPTLGAIRKQIGPQVAHLSDEQIIGVYRYAEAMAGLKVELIFFEAGIPGRVQH